MASSSFRLPTALPGGSPPPEISHTTTTFNSSKRKLAADSPSERTDKTRRTDSDRHHPPMYLSAYDGLLAADQSQTFAPTLFCYNKIASSQSVAGPCPKGQASSATNTRASTPSSDSESSEDLGDVKNLENSEDSEDAGGSDDELPERAEPYKQPPPTSYQTHQTSPSKGKGKLVATPRPYVPYSFRRRYKPVSSMDDVASALHNTGSGGAPEDVRVASYVHIPISPRTFLRRRVPPKLSSDDCECTICVRALAKRLEDAAPFAERREQLLAASQGVPPWYAGGGEGMSMPRLYGPGVPPPFEVPCRLRLKYRAVSV